MTVFTVSEDLSGFLKGTYAKQGTIMSYTRTLVNGLLIYAVTGKKEAGF